LGASGLLTRRRRRRRALIAAITAGVIVLVLAGGTGFAYITVDKQAKELQAQLTVHLQTGQSELEAAKTSLKQANVKHDQISITQAKTHFAAAKTQFTLASQLADGSMLLRSLERLPTVGDSVRSRHVAVDGIATMGVALSEAGQDLADLEGQLITPPDKNSSAGRKLLTVLGASKGTIADARLKLSNAQKAAAGVDIRVIPTGQQAAFTKAREAIAAALAAIEEFESLVPVLTEILGGNGARTYLIEQANPAELRPGGGFIGTFTVLKADHGAVTSVENGSSGLLSYPRASEGTSGYVAPPGPLHQLLGPASWSFFDSNFFPDFPSNAKAGERFAQPKLGRPINGVISIDYYAVAKMLELTGPLAIPGYGITVNSKNFIPLIVQHDLAKDAIHKAILSAVAGPLVHLLTKLPAARWPALITALNDLAATHHLQAYFNNAAVEAEIGRFGWSGSLNPTKSRDFMTEVESNLGATKANYFVTRHYTMTLTRSGSVLHHKITVDLVNTMPYFYRPDEFYRAYIALFVGTNASGLSNNLLPGLYPNPSPPTGTRLSAGWVTVPGYGSRGQAVFEYNTPWVADNQGADRIYWQKQPGTDRDAIDLVWNDGKGHSFKASGSLSLDQVITLGSAGVTLTAGQPAQAKLPSLSLG